MAADDLNKNLQGANQQASQLVDQYGNILSSEKQITEEKKKQSKYVEDEIQALKDLRGAIQGNISELTGKAKAYADGTRAARGLQSISEQLLQDARGETELNEKQLEQLRQKADFARQALEEDIKQGDLTNDQRNNFQAILDESEKLLKIAEQRFNFEKKINEAQGLSGGIAGGLQGVLDKLGGGKFSKALGIDDALKKNKDFTKDLIKGGADAGKLGTKFKVAGNLVKNLGKNLLKSLGPITLIAELIQGIGRADKSITELGKSMALTKNEAEDIYSAMGGAAADSANLSITTEKLVKNFTALNKQLGFVNNFTLDTLVTMTKLTEQVGLSAEEAGALVTLSEARGKNAEDEYKSALATSYQLQRQSGIQFDLREILKDIGKISGQLRANLGANPKAMAEAVTLAKQLGGSLNEIKSVSSAILDFESSIAAELEAELLTGKEINLERARLAALNGDIADLTREIASQVGTFTEFSKMNVIQQDALAKSFGLQSDQLADMLFKQQVMGRSAKELRALGEEELAQRVEQQTMADKFNQTIEKLKGIFADVGGAIVPVIELLGFALSIVGAIAALIMDIVRMLKGDFDFSATAASFESLGAQLGFESNGGSGYNSGGARVASSRSSSNSESRRTNELLEKLINKDPNIYMDDRKLSTGMDMNNYAVGS